MEELQKKIKTILSELDKNLKNVEDAEFAKTKVLELYEAFSDELERIEETCTNKMDIISAKYSVLETRMEEIQGTINKIEKDIYIDNDDEYDLDIMCPYCDAEFTIDVSDELRNSVTCPECNNVIELDWNEEDEACEHDCSECNHACEHEEDEDDDM